MEPTPTGGWSDVQQVEWYTARIGRLSARQAGEDVLGDALPACPRRVLDLGCGDGRLSALVLDRRSSVESVVAVDVSPPMLERAVARFTNEPRVSVIEWDLRQPLAPIGHVDLVVSGFAIHHLEDRQKRDLFKSVADLLDSPGTFFNLEVVRSATPKRHAEFLELIGRTADDNEDRLAGVDDQMLWMRQAGLTNVECLWRWRGFALLAGEME